MHMLVYSLYLLPRHAVQSAPCSTCRLAKPRSVAALHHCPVCDVQVNVPGLLKPHPVLAQQLISLPNSVSFRKVAPGGVSCFGWALLCSHYGRVLSTLMPLHSELGDPELAGGHAGLLRPDGFELPGPMQVTKCKCCSKRWCNDAGS
jgi:hypothetical protein